MKKLILALCLILSTLTANAGITNDILGITLGECDTVMYNKKTKQYDLVSVIAGERTILLSLPKEIVDTYNEGQDNIIAARDMIDTMQDDWRAYGYQLMEYGERQLMIANLMFDNYLLFLQMNPEAE